MTGVVLDSMVETYDCCFAKLASVVVVGKLHTSELNCLNPVGP